MRGGEVPATLLLLVLLPTLATARVPIASHRRTYERDHSQVKLRYGKGQDFRFGRFQRPADVKRAFEDCRKLSSFKEHVGKDGRVGKVCSTKLGGDWVLAESDQIAVSTTCEQVLKAYLDGSLQKRWSADKVIDVKTTMHKRPPYIRQDLVLHSQRVIRSHTGVMRYSQRITVDKIGSGNFVAFVELDPEVPSTEKKPFNSLAVYVGLEQVGKDVAIYAAGVFEVNRRVVPNLVVFDASGIAGDMAGKGTLWLAGHFAEVAKAAAAMRRRTSRGRRLLAKLDARQRLGQMRERYSGGGADESGR